MNGFREGYGRIIYDDGEYYEGQFKEDKKDGFGKYVWSKGNSYIG